MAEQQPRKGDNLVGQVVEARLDDGTVHAVGRAVSFDGNPKYLIDVGDGEVVPWPAHMVELADDPAKDLVGAIRRQPAGGSEEGNGSTLGVRAIRWATETATDTPWVYFRWDGPQVLSNESVAGWVRSGSVPDSPAAQAEKPARQVPMELRQKLADALVSGDKAKAITIARNWGMDRDTALSYIAAMPEHQTYLNHWFRKTEDVQLPADPGPDGAPPLHADNEAIVTGQYPQQRERRVFRSDGPEPPEDVTVLEMVNTKSALRGTPYLKRLPGEPSAWSWVAYPGQKVSREWGHSRWPINDVVFLGEFREVV